jgi:chromosomal replication initiation ATPase DnaA
VNRQEALGRLKVEIPHRGAISDGTELHRALRCDDILVGSCRYFDVSRQEVLESRNERRNMAIYLVKRNTALTNRKIGEMFGDISYSAIFKGRRRFWAKLRTDRRLKDDAEGVMAIDACVGGTGNSD